jgi:hypothetical protein
MNNPLRALVVHESMFGNTAQVAAAVARGLELEDVETTLVEVWAAPVHLPPDLDLLVVGGPTHAFSLSRASTRADAVRQGSKAEHTDVGIREWLDFVTVDADHAPLVATFDTRVSKVRWLPKAAGPTAAHLARRRGLTPISKPAGFLVEDIRGPLVDGETQRAVEWGRRLGTELVDRAAARIATQGG